MKNINKAHLVELFEFIISDGRGCASVDVLKTQYLEHLEMVRKVVMRERENTDINALGYNVYEKKDIQFSELYEAARSFIEFGDDCILTEEGKRLLNNIYTNNSRREYLKYKGQVESLISEMNISMDSQTSAIKRDYYRKRSLAEIRELYNGIRKDQCAMEKYHLDNIVALGIKTDNDHRILQIIPELLLPEHSPPIPAVSLEVSYKVKQLEQLNLEVRRPYSNKCRCAGIKKIAHQKRKILGFYIKIPKYCDSLELTYRWTLADLCTLYHHFTINFDRALEEKDAAIVNGQFFLYSTLSRQRNLCSELNEDDMRFISTMKDLSQTRCTGKPKNTTQKKYQENGSGHAGWIHPEDAFQPSDKWIFSGRSIFQ